MYRFTEYNEADIKKTIYIIHKNIHPFKRRTKRNLLFVNKEKEAEMLENVSKQINVYSANASQSLIWERERKKGELEWWKETDETSTREQKSERRTRDSDELILYYANQCFPREKERERESARGDLSAAACLSFPLRRRHRFKWKRHESGQTRRAETFPRDLSRIYIYLRCFSKGRLFVIIESSSF